MTARDEIRAAATHVAAPYQEWPTVIRRRKVTVGIVLVVGAVAMAAAARALAESALETAGEETAAEIETFLQGLGE